MLNFSNDRSFADLLQDLHCARLKKQSHTVQVLLASGKRHRADDIPSTTSKCAAMLSLQDTFPVMEP